MDTIRCLGCTALLLLLAAPAARGQWERYQPRTLRQLTTEQVEEMRTFLEPPAPDVALSGRDFPSRVRVIYTGQSRELTGASAQLLWLWVAAFGIEPEDAALFAREMLFREGSDEYWLPVQDPLIPHFESELRPGDSVTLYLIWIGARREGDEVVGVFLVNEFDKEPGP